ncbi:hypothetical protein H6P81_008255 [Aristolochia fimbriata]|uniref:Uncharacterized protein n=1 Tax=Aristolochia fimbriata TaxID=158543 RepID=A0AAV7F5D7_ARIFI|nr:hypothetical protein H6P81_008255 [Aristolochia fimbriata]
MPSASNISAPETLKQSQSPTKRKILTTPKIPERKSRDGGKSRLIEEKRPALIDPNENRMERSGDLSPSFSRTFPQSNRTSHEGIRSHRCLLRRLFLSVRSSALRSVPQDACK